MPVLETATLADEILMIAAAMTAAAVGMIGMLAAVTTAAIIAILVTTETLVICATRAIPRDQAR